MRMNFKVSCIYLLVLFNGAINIGAIECVFVVRQK
jgi:hypothetical protein